MKQEDLCYRWLNAGDAEMVNDWLKGWKKNSLDVGMYPETGLVLFNQTDETPVYAGFVWIPNTSNMAMIGFVTRNPFYKKKLPKNTREKFLNMLIWLCKELGKEYVITWTDNQALVSDFKKLGLTETSNKCSELLAKII
ncbi:MAG: hypothetical protein LBE36_13595 [Flavobacteriaceae bacterium]|jgi:hypothetical protein|nr:hypothetical protein [Flavobacteriaceae bacterium]